MTWRPSRDNPLELVALGQLGRTYHVVPVLDYTDHGAQDSALVLVDSRPDAVLVDMLAARQYAEGLEAGRTILHLGQGAQRA